jgi:hypothetical protein
MLLLLLNSCSVYHGVSTWFRPKRQRRCASMYAKRLMKLINAKKIQTFRAKEHQQSGAAVRESSKGECPWPLCNWGVVLPIPGKAFRHGMARVADAESSFGGGMVRFPLRRAPIGPIDCVQKALDRLVYICRSGFGHAGRVSHHETATIVVVRWSPLNCASRLVRVERRKKAKNP